MCCTVSVSIPQNLHDGSPLNKPMVRRHPFKGVCPVTIATTIFCWCLPNLSRSSALFLHGLPMKSLPCQNFCWYPIISTRVFYFQRFFRAPLILNLSTRLRWEVSLPPRSLYPRQNIPQYPLNRKLGGPRCRCGSVRKRQKKSLPGFELYTISPVD